MEYIDFVVRLAANPENNNDKLETGTVKVILPNYSVAVMCLQNIVKRTFTALVYGHDVASRSIVPGKWLGPVQTGNASLGRQACSGLVPQHCLFRTPFNQVLKGPGLRYRSLETFCPPPITSLSPLVLVHPLCWS